MATTTGAVLNAVSRGQLRAPHALAVDLGPLVLSRSRNSRG